MKQGDKTEGADRRLNNTKWKVRSGGGGWREVRDAFR